MRLRNISNSKEILESNKLNYISESNNLKGKWNLIFGNKNPIHLEIGIGAGDFIIGMAKEFPNINFIGIDYKESILVKTSIKLQKEKVENIKILKFDANNLLDLFIDNEISYLYLNFSDPWHKNRHEHRRLTYKDKLQVYNKISSTNEISLKTDNVKYFEYSIMSFNNYGSIFEMITLDLHSLDIFNIMTEYENKFHSKGNPIFKIEVTLK